MNKVKIVICGKEYKLNTELSPEYLSEIARIIDKKFESAFNDDKNLTLFDASVLVSMEIADESIKASSDLANLRSRITAYSEEIDDLKTKVQTLKKQLSDQKQINKSLTADRGLKDLKTQLDNIKKPENLKL